MRIDKLPNLITPQYIREEPANKSGNDEPLKNPLALRYRAIALLQSEDPTSGGAGTLLSLYRSKTPVKDVRLPTPLSLSYDFTDSNFQCVDQFSVMVRQAYNGRSSRDYKGIYIDKIA